MALCLNEKLNPFQKDALDRSALEYAAQYKKVCGYDMQQLIQRAIE